MLIELPTWIEPDLEAIANYENVVLNEDIRHSFAREMLPHVLDAWFDTSCTDGQDGETSLVGHEIGFKRYFQKHQRARLLETIDANLKQVEDEMVTLLPEVAK